MVNDANYTKDWNDTEQYPHHNTKVNQQWFPQHQETSWRRSENSWTWHNKNDKILTQQTAQERGIRCISRNSSYSCRVVTNCFHCKLVLHFPWSKDINLHNMGLKAEIFITKWIYVRVKAVGDTYLWIDS